ncbi:hypothetical protein D6D08_10262 [Aureobasidium pullulans]|nr:hypothetical protein D6D08_10262 [Aureobasidium pullulans]
MKLTTVIGISAAATTALAQGAWYDSVRFGFYDSCKSSPDLNYWTVGYFRCQTIDPLLSSPFVHVEPLYGVQQGLISNAQCRLVLFDDTNCIENGRILMELGEGPRHDDHIHEALTTWCFETPPDFQSFKWACATDIQPQWEHLEIPGFPVDQGDYAPAVASLDIANAPAVASRANAMDKGVKGRVKVWPADNEDCNSPNKRKPESFNHDDCQHFNNGFRSIRATADFHKQEYTHRCALLAYTDHKCKVNPAYVVDLYDTAKLGVCLAVNLKQDDSHLMAGHSVKWICDDLLDEFFNSTSQAKIEDTTSTVIAESVNPTVTTVTVGCTLTSDVRFSTTASSHVTTETSVSTHLTTHTHVVTHIQSHTIPFSSTYSVCDVEVSTLY